MFGEQFYPTPDHVIYKMTSGIQLRGHILDPSAGDGRLLDKIKSFTTTYGRWPDLYAIEIDPGLRAILADKGHKIIGADFLQYSGHYYFDFIIMNPPFKDGVKHLLKAWSIANGATIRCLLNSQTLENVNTREREELESIIDRYGQVEKLGQVFKNSDRPTNVEVSLVTLWDTRPKESFRLDFDPQRMGGQAFNLGNIEDTELASADIFENYEARFNAGIEAFKQMLTAYQQAKYYLDDLFDYGNITDILADVLKKNKEIDDIYRETLKTVNHKAWDKLFTRTKLRSLTTEGVRDELAKMQGQQGDMAFTADNMKDLFEVLFINREQIMVNCILEAFDLMTKYYPENRIAVEGWKTNSSYRVGKFILPGIGSVWGDGVDYRSSRTLDDIEKALCFLSSQKFETITPISELYRNQSHYGQWVKSTFFKTQLFKKGTMHFKWLDQNLCDEFNALVGRQRWGWVPEKTKKGVYK